MTNVTGATCTVSPALPTGLNIDSSTCTISGTPSVATTNTTYTITAIISGTTFQTSVWLSSENYQLTPSVEGADLFIGEAMTPITFSHSYQIPQGYVTSGNNSTWYLQPTAGSQAYILPCYQPNMVEMGDYYLAECEDDLSILDFNAGTRTTIIANAHPYNHQTNSKLLWSVEADGTRYYMLKNGSMYEFDEVARDLVYITSIQSLGAQGMQFVSNTNTCFDCLPLLNGEFYFHLKTTMGGQNQIWKSDGTASGTVPVANISSTYMVGDDFLPFVYNGEIYYSDFASGTTTLSASDGTVSGTRIVHQDNTLRPLATSMKYGATFNGEYYYLQQSGIVKTDGTAAGTTFIADCPELYMSNPRPELFVFDQNLYWIGECLGNTGTGNELYKFDGTSASLVANFVPDSSTNNVDGVAWNAGSVNFKVWNETHFAFDGGVDNCHPNNCEMDDLYISDGTSSGTVVVMDGHIYAHETQNKHSIIGSVVYHSSSRSHGTEWCYTDLTGVRANPINGSSAPAEVCFGVASGQYQTHHGYVASFNIDDTLVILMRPANGNYGNYGAGMQYYSYAPNNITTSTPPPVIWSTDPALPSGIGISNGVISGTPTVATSNTTYTVTATINNITLQTDIWLSSSTFGEITSTVDGAELQLGEAMTPISLNYNSQAPPGSTIYGNGSIWTTRSTTAGVGFPSGLAPGIHFHAVVGDVIYFDGQCSNAAWSPCKGRELWAYDTSNQTGWLVKEIGPSYYSGSPGIYWEQAIVMGDTLYFPAVSTGSWQQNKYELHAFDISNQTLWQITNSSASNPIWEQYQSQREVLPKAIGDTIFFAYDDGTTGKELWAHNTLNGTTWQVIDLRTGQNYNDSNPGQKLTKVVDGVLYFSANNGSYDYLWAHNPSNGTTWVVSSDVIMQCTPASSIRCESVVANGVIYFQGNEVYTSSNSNTNGKELWAYSTLNGSAWLAADINDVGSNNQHSNPGKNFMIAIGDEIYFDAEGWWDIGDGFLRNVGHEVWAYSASNGSYWLAYNSRVESSVTVLGSNPGYRLSYAIGDKLYFSADNPSNTYSPGLYVYDTSTHEGWRVDGISTVNGHFNTQSIVMGDNIILDASPAHGYGCHSQNELMVHSQSNNTTWNLHNCAGNILGILTGDRIMVNIGDKLYFNDNDDLMGYYPQELTMNTPPPTTWETEPPLPAGMSISGGTISGTPSVYASNQTYTIYANQSGQTTTHELYFSVDNAYPHTVVEDQPIDAIGFHPAFWDGTTTWSISPSLPNTLLQDSATGEITGTVDSPLSDTFTVTATHSSGASETFTFSLESLLDTDGDGLANDLPPTYNPANPPTSGLIADDDDDGDGLLDSVETDTGLYINGQDTGTDPLDPDTDDDGICDGPNAVPPVCIAGPDPSPNGNTPPPTLVGVNNTDIGTVSPYLVVPGGTFEISPDLPLSLSIDANTGEITGTPTQTLTNTTFTVWCNHTDGTSVSWDFTIEILEDSDGDGMPNELPDDYDPTNPDSPGLIEDLDDDNDGNSDVDEEADGTDPTNPDTDGDGMCDGPVAFEPDCVAGPDAFPLDPSADTDTDGDGDPDTLNPPSTSVPPLVEDLDDDGDGIEDVNETNTGIYNGDTDTGTDPLDPDTDNDGICDGPVDVLPICVLVLTKTLALQLMEQSIWSIILKWLC